MIWKFNIRALICRLIGHRVDTETVVIIGYGRFIAPQCSRCHYVPAAAAMVGQ